MALQFNKTARVVAKFRGCEDVELHVGGHGAHAILVLRPEEVSALVDKLTRAVKFASPESDTSFDEVLG